MPTKGSALPAAAWLARILANTILVRTYANIAMPTQARKPPCETGSKPKTLNGLQKQLLGYNKPFSKDKKQAFFLFRLFLV